MSSRFISSALLVFALAGSAVALPLTQPNALLNHQDFNVHGVTLNAGQSATGTFDILSAGSGSTAIMSGYANAGAVFSDIGGYVLNTSITSATAYFYVRNGNQGNDVVNINLGGSLLFDGNTGAGNSFAILGGAASISLLQLNGVLSYTITQSGSTGGSSFIFDYAQLQVTTSANPSQGSSVPDGGISLGLLALGLASLGFLHRLMPTKR